MEHIIYWFGSAYLWMNYHPLGQATMIAIGVCYIGKAFLAKD